MENTSYALYIAVGALIAIVILSIVLIRWRKIGFLEDAKDEAVAVKNKAEFNAEYEAYNKALMYGTDVLSCLNKAQNNNQKYVYNNYYGTDNESIGKDDREEYFIDVTVRLNSDLYDEVKAYYKDRAGKYQRIVGLDRSNSAVINNYSDKLFLSTSEFHFDDPVVYYYYFKQGKVYQETKNYTSIMWTAASKNKTLLDILAPASSTDEAGKIKTTIQGNREYHLLTSEDTTSISSLDETAKLAALITTVSLKNQDRTNREQPSSFDKNDWWYCTWTTAASDFKSRKFRCTGITYDENNGYVIGIGFEEV